MHPRQNIVGYLQKKNFFNRSPSPISPHSRFNNYTSNKTPEKKSVNQTPVRILNSQSNLHSLKESNNYSKKKSIFEGNRLEETRKKWDQTEKISLTRKRGLDSSKVEIKMCLEDLAKRVSSELKMLEGTMNDLSVHIQNLFQKRLVFLKQKMLESVENIFSETQRNLKNELQQSEFFHFKQASQTKINLKQADTRLKRFKVQMDSNWKKVAGQVLLQSLDDKLQDTLVESENIRRQLLLKMGKSDKKGEEQGWILMKNGIDMLLKAKFMEYL